MYLNPLEAKVCHNVDKITPIQERDAYRVTCTCGEQREVEGHEMVEITRHAKEVLDLQIMLRDAGEN